MLRKVTKVKELSRSTDLSAPLSQPLIPHLTLPGSRPTSDQLSILSTIGPLERSSVSEDLLPFSSILLSQRKSLPKPSEKLQ